jgi:hypothetical protein
MARNEMPRRLLASFAYSNGPWKVHVKGKGRLILRREEIVSPLFSPLWFLGGIFFFYIGWVINLCIEHGWHGIPILLVPLVVALWMATNGPKSNFRPERLEFNKSGRILKIFESNGKNGTYHSWAYADIAKLCLSTPPTSRETRVTTAVIIKHTDTNFSAVRIEGLEEVVSIYRAIDELLPPTVERT